MNDPNGPRRANNTKDYSLAIVNTYTGRSRCTNSRSLFGQRAELVLAAVSVNAYCTYCFIYYLKKDDALTNSSKRVSNSSHVMG